MDVFFSVVGLILAAVVAFVVARFVLRLAARVVGCGMTVLVGVGILAIIWWFFLR